MAQEDLEIPLVGGATQEAQNRKSSSDDDAEKEFKNYGSKRVYVTKYNMKNPVDDVADPFNDTLVHYFMLNNGDESILLRLSYFGLLMLGAFTPVGVLLLILGGDSVETAVSIVSALGILTAFGALFTTFKSSKIEATPYLFCVKINDDGIGVLKIIELKYWMFYYDMQKMDDDQLICDKYADGSVLLRIHLNDIISCNPITGNGSRKGKCTDGFVQLEYKVPVPIPKTNNNVNVNDIENDKKDSKESMVKHVVYKTIVNEKAIKMTCIYEAVNFVNLCVAKNKNYNLR